MRYSKKILLFLLIFIIYVKGFSQIGTYCPGQNNVGFGVNGNFSNSTFIWNVQGATITTDLGDTIYVNMKDTSGICTIEVIEISQAGCAGEPVYAQFILQSISVDIGADIDICQGDIYEIVPDNESFASYTWQDGTNTVRYTASTSGSYWVNIVDALGCTASDTMVLTVHDNPVIDLGNDTSMCEPGELLTLQVDEVFNIYNWSTGAQSPAITIEVSTETREFWLQVEDQWGCIGSDTIIVTFCGTFEIPNAFTPNGDQWNNEWRIDNLAYFPDCTVDIYDRRGERVFHSKGYERPWDGTDSKGRKMPMDSYYYVIDLHNGEKPFVGTVTLLR